MPDNAAPAGDRWRLACWAQSLLLAAAAGWCLHGLADGVPPAPPAPPPVVPPAPGPGPTPTPTPAPIPKPAPPASEFAAAADAYLGSFGEATRQVAREVRERKLATKSQVVARLEALREAARASWAGTLDRAFAAVTDGATAAWTDPAVAADLLDRVAAALEGARR